MRRGVRAFLRCDFACALRACVRRARVWLLPHKSGRGGLVQRRRAPVQQLWLRRGLDRLQRSETMQAFNAAMTRPRRLDQALRELGL